MKEEEIQIQMDDGVARLFTRSSLQSLEGICLFVDLWETQPCLGDPE